MSFVIKHIDMDLTPASIDHAIKQVEYIRNRIHPAMTHLINQLTEKGVEIARAELLFFDRPAYDTGELSESIRSVQCEDGIGYVRTDCPYAIYVECGTGYGFDDGNALGVGRSGKPMHSMMGWYYFNERAGKTFWTEGMEARPFMYHTFEGLLDEAEAKGGRVVAEYLAGDDGA